MSIYYYEWKDANGETWLAEPSVIHPPKSVDTPEREFLADRIASGCANEILAMRERAEKAEVETGWLIENVMSGPPRWWTGKRRAESPYCWTANAADAVRFCRESDAQRVIEWACWGDSKHIFPTEHRWG